MRAIFLLAAAAIAMGCGPASTRGDTGSAGSDAGPLDQDVGYVEAVCTPSPDDTFCPAYAEAFCDGHLDCCTTTEPGFRYESRALCVQRTLCICTAARDGAAFTSGRVSFDETAAAAVLADVSAAAASCQSVDVASLSANRAYVGTLAEGSDCSPEGPDFSNLFACAPGHFCWVSDFGGEGAPPVASCQRLRSAGENCDGAGEACGPGLHCAGTDPDLPGTCTAMLAAGEPCTDDFECRSELCDEVSSTCVAPDADDTWCVDADLDA